VNNLIAFHDDLNTNLFENKVLRPQVRLALMRIAIDFYRFLDVPGLKLTGVVITGSNVAYTYTEVSDIDLHLIVDFDNSTCPDLAENFFMTKKSLWNEVHDVSVKGHQVEVYVEDIKRPARSNGVYDLLDNRWMLKPQKRRPAFDDDSILVKAMDLADLIDITLVTEDPARITRLLDRLRSLRQAGLEREGEFSTENLVFKTLRSLGYWQRLWDRKRKLEDMALTLESR
jgi:hypothetical protein